MFSTMAKFKGTHTQMHVLKKVEKGKIMKLLDIISELISNTDVPKFENMLGGKG